MFSQQSVCPCAKYLKNLLTDFDEFFFVVDIVH